MIPSRTKTECDGILVPQSVDGHEDHKALAEVDAPIINADLARLAIRWLNDAGPG